MLEAVNPAGVGCAARGHNPWGSLPLCGSLQASFWGLQFPAQNLRRRGGGPSISLPLWWMAGRGVGTPTLSLGFLQNPS